MSTKDVPQSALRFEAAEFSLGDNGDGAKSAPFRMVARSGQPIEHWFWGRVVHDMDGMQLHKQRVAIDYAHDDREVIGYANSFSTESGDLVVSGALVPFKESDRATEIIHKQKAGVPYEASINFGGDGIKIEQIAEGHFTQVNGYQFDGPGIVIREWPLRGIAVCPYGADANTSTTFAAGDTITVEIKEATAMADDLQKPDDEQQTPEVTPTVEGTETADNDTAEAAAAVDAVAELTARKAEGQRFIEAFGNDGAVWFAQGLTFEDAQTQFVKTLREENESLKQRLSGAGQSLGEEDALEFSEAKPPQKKSRLIRLAGKRYDE